METVLWFKLSAIEPDTCVRQLILNLTKIYWKKIVFLHIFSSVFFLAPCFMFPLCRVIAFFVGLDVRTPQSLVLFSFCILFLGYLNCSQSHKFMPSTQTSPKFACNFSKTAQTYHVQNRTPDLCPTYSVPRPGGALPASSLSEWHCPRVVQARSPEQSLTPHSSLFSPSVLELCRFCLT